MTHSSFWDEFVTRSLTIYANMIFLVMWVGFLFALAVNREWLALLWNWAQALPPLPKIIVWAVFLPVLVGLWIWQSSWPMLGRLAGLAGILGWTLLAVNSWFKTFR